MQLQVGLVVEAGEAFEVIAVEAGQRTGDLTGPVGAEVEKDDGVARFNTRVAPIGIDDAAGFNELVCDPRVVVGLHGGRGRIIDRPRSM